MKKTFFSALLFFVIIGFVLFSHNFLIKFCENILIYCDNIQENLNSIENNHLEYENNPYLLSKSEELENYITSNYSIVSLYLNHETIDSLYIDSLSLNEFLKTQDISQSLSMLSSIKAKTQIIIELQKVNLQNIL